uniref:Uncharacterized protein n=1 Tax=Candidatus Kentrum sp. TC TaxID=2126339 RepID=A0A450YNW3_9GAMM|nr:MAG: hypothetical protein BECKTC1821D_GA0114238_101612 [Candidatus Kentron sp. TC]
MRVASENFSRKVEVEDRFIRMLNGLARDRREQGRKWEEHLREWREQREEDR